MELGGGRLDERVDLGEGVRADNVDGLQGRREGRRGGRRARCGGEGRVGRGLGVCVDEDAVGRACGGGREGGSGGGGLKVAGETGEDQHEEDEAVFAAVVGERELFDAVGGWLNVSLVGVVLGALCVVRSLERNEGAGSGTYLYLSSASSMTATASLTCACTLLRILVSTSSARKASTLSCSSKQTCRKLGEAAAAAAVAEAEAAASSPCTPPLAAEPLARWPPCSIIVCVLYRIGRQVSHG